MSSFISKITLGFILSLALQAHAEKVVFLEKAQESLQARYDLITSAQKTIEAQYFNVDNDRISISSLALLRDAALRGVKVRILVDSMNNLLPRELMAALISDVDTGKSLNIEIRSFNQFNIANPLCYTRRMHDKALIIDGQYLVVGDRNVANGYYDQEAKSSSSESLPIFEGMDVLLAGSASQQALSYFNQRWNSKDVKSINMYEYSHEKIHDPATCTYTESNSAVCEQKRRDDVALLKSEIKKLEDSKKRIESGKGLVQAKSGINWLANAYETSDVKFIHDEVTSVCKGKSEQNIGAEIYKTIDENTQESLLITTPYLVVTQQMQSLMTKLVDRGVKVRIITNSLESNDVAGAHAGYLKTRHQLLNLKNEKSGGSVKIYEFSNIEKGTFVTLHAKMILMDNKKVFVGSYNWDFRSQNLNSEVGVLIGLSGVKKSSSVSAVRERLADFLRTSDLVSLKEVNSDNQSTTPAFLSMPVITKNLSADNLNKAIEVSTDRKNNVGFWNSLLKLEFLGLIEQL